MANPRVVVDVIMDALKLKRGARESEEAVGRLDKVLEKLGKGKDKIFDALSGSAKSLAKDNLGPLGDIADKAGVDLDEMKGKTLAAGAAVAALGVFVAGGVRKLSELTGQVREFHEQSGASFESSSRMVGVIKDLGVEVDNASELMGELARGIDEGKLDEYGIQAVRAKDGTIDLVATLGNVADKMNATVDPTKKSAMGAALFGEEWVRLAPLLNQGSAGLSKMAAELDDSRIVTEEAAREQQAMDAAMRQLGTSVDELQMSMAQGLVPALSQTARGMSKVLEDLNRLGDRVGWLDGVLSSSATKEIDQFNELLRMGGKIEVASLAVAKAKQAMGAASVTATVEELDLAAAQAEAADQVDILKKRTEDATEAAKEMTAKVKDQTAALDIARESVMSVGGAVREFSVAQLRTADAADTLTEKQKAVTDAINEFGDDSPEATKAQRDYEKATIDAVAAADDQAHAAANQAEKLAIAAGQTFTAEQKNIVYRDSLNEVRDATNDPNFVAGMDNLIALTGDAAANADIAQRKLWDMAAAASAAALAAAGVGRTGGGDMASVTADNADRILSNQRSGFINQRSGEQAPSITIINNAPIGKPDDVVRWMQSEIRKVERGKR